MCLRLLYLIITRLFAWMRLSRRDESRKSAEILLLRHQLTVLQRVGLKNLGPVCLLGSA
jgi:putative transposase